MNKHFATDLPPDKMRLILDGDVLYHQGQRQGTYLLANNVSINNQAYWYQQDGNYGIWFGQFYTGWIFGSLDVLGQDNGGIIGPSGQEIIKWPTQIISNSFTYWNSTNWVPASSNEFVLDECEFLYVNM